MFYLRMTPQAVYLLLGHVFFMHEFNITVFFRSVHMTEITFIFWGDTVTFRHFRMALIAFVARLKRLVMGEGLPHDCNGLFGRRMARGTTEECLIVGYPLEMAEVAHIHRDPAVRSLNDI